MQHIANNTPAKTAFVVARCVSFGAVPVGMLRELLTHAVHADLILLARGPCAAVDVARANYLGRDEAADVCDRRWPGWRQHQVIAE
jgi:hypothetical protein